MDSNQRPSWITKLGKSLERLRQSEDQLSLVLSLVIGALVGLVVVAFILLTGRLAARMYPSGGSGWRRILVPTLGSLSIDYLLYRYFPFARGSGIPQTKFALFINDGRILFRTVLAQPHLPAESRSGVKVRQFRLARDSRRWSHEISG